MPTEKEDFSNVICYVKTVVKSNIYIAAGVRVTLDDGRWFVGKEGDPIRQLTAELISEYTEAGLLQPPVSRSK